MGKKEKEEEGATEVTDDRGKKYGKKEKEEEDNTVEVLHDRDYRGRHCEGYCKTHRKRKGKRKQRMQEGKKEDVGEVRIEGEEKSTKENGRKEAKGDAAEVAYDGEQKQCGTRRKTRKKIL